MTDIIVCPPEHKHQGTCYQDHRCRCANCREYKAALKRRERRLTAYGRYEPPFVDAAPARQHLANLSAFGIGAARVAEVAGIDVSVTQRILYGSRSRTGAKLPPSRRITPIHAAAILAVTASLENISENYPAWPALGAHRRIQALVARGWSYTGLGILLGVTSGAVSQILEHQVITPATHRRIAALYDQLWDKLPDRTTPHAKAAFSRMVHYAEARRWVVPALWDDIDTDTEPPATPYDHTVDDIAVELACSGETVRLNPAERREVITVLHPRKWSDKLMAAHADCDERTVLRIRQELGLEAWDQNELTDRRAA